MLIDIAQLVNNLFLCGGERDMACFEYDYGHGDDNIHKTSES